MPSLPVDRHLVSILYDLIPLLEPDDYLKTASPMERWLLATRQPARWRQATRVVAISEEVRRCGLEMIGLAPEQVQVVHPGLDHSMSPAEPSNSIGSPFFLHVGAIESRKNIRRLVAAFAAARVDPSSLMVFVGPMAPFRRAMLESWGKESGVLPRLRILGHVSDAKLQALYRDCIAFVFPSLHEGFGFPPLEAMKVGTPVLASRSSCMPEVLGDAACWCDGLDIASIAEGLTTLATDSVLRAELRHRGPPQAGLYTWDNAGKRLAQIIASIGT